MKKTAQVPPVGKNTCSTEPTSQSYHTNRHAHGRAVAYRNRVHFSHGCMSSGLMPRALSF